MMKRFAIFAMLAAVGPWAIAQRGGGAGAHAGFHGGTARHAGGSRGTSFVHGGLGRSRFGRYGYGYGYGTPYDYLSLPFPFFDNAYDSGDMYSTGYPVAAPLPPYLPPASAIRSYDNSVGPVMRSQAPQPSQPLMIEFQNGRYVQVSSTAIDGDAAPLDGASNEAAAERPTNQRPTNRRPTNRQSNGGPRATGPRITAAATDEMAPVVLLFRDGHSEQVRDYTIANGILYARGDYYTDGYWNKKIDLAALNVPETLQANASRGVRFVLPSSPNEVVTRP